MLCPSCGRTLVLRSERMVYLCSICLAVGVKLVEEGLGRTDPTKETGETYQYEGYAGVLRNLEEK